jgi:hypothetical protein
VVQFKQLLTEYFCGLVPRIERFVKLGQSDTRQLDPDEFIDALKEEIRIKISKVITIFMNKYLINLFNVLIYFFLYLYLD